MLRTFLLGSIAMIVAGCATSDDSGSSAPRTTPPRLEYYSSQLMMMNSDQMNDMVKKKMQAAENAQAAAQTNDDEGIVAEPEAIEALTSAMRLTLSRPDQDGTRDVLFARLRRELIDLNSLDQVLQGLADEALNGSRDHNPPKVQATYITVLENLMAEIKPEVNRNENMKKIIESIRDANLKVSEEAQGQQRLHTMKRLVSPSETAGKIVPKKKK